MDALLTPRDLAPKDRNGASDPFVRVRYNGRTQETSVRRPVGCGGGREAQGWALPITWELSLGLPSHRGGSEKRETSLRVQSGSQPFWHQPLWPQPPFTPG